MPGCGILDGIRTTSVFPGPGSCGSGVNSEILGSGLVICVVGVARFVGLRAFSPPLPIVHIVKGMRAESVFSRCILYAPERSKEMHVFLG